MFLEGKFDRTIQLLDAQMQQASKDKILRTRLGASQPNRLNQASYTSGKSWIRNGGLTKTRWLSSQSGEKIHIIQMGLRQGVLLGKKEFTVDLQPQVEQEFLKAFYALTRFREKFCLTSPAGKTRRKSALGRISLRETPCASNVNGSQDEAINCALYS